MLLTWTAKEATNHFIKLYTCYLTSLISPTWRYSKDEELRANLLPTTGWYNPLPTVSGVQTILVVWLRVAWRSKYCRCMAHPGSVYDEVTRSRLNSSGLLAVATTEIVPFGTWKQALMSDEIDLAGPKKKRKKMADTVQIHGEATCRNERRENFGQARGSPIQLSEGKDGETSVAEADPILMLVIWWHPICKLIEMKVLALCVWYMWCQAD